MQCFDTTLKAQAIGYWYFNSGCSWHKIEDKYFFTHLDNVKYDSITFGDGVK